jgi:hypothetical protein
LAQIIDGDVSGPDPLRPRAGLLAALLTLVFAALTASLLMPGVLLTAAMEPDVLHLIDAVARREAGQLAHLDFITPLGDLSIEAIAFWRRVFDMPLGMSMLLANVSVMAATLPLAIWAGVSRLGFWPGVALGTYCLLLAAALSWQVGGVSVTFAMSYNRWAWALAIPMTVLLLTRPRHPGGRADLFDGLAIGLTAAALAWLKASYAVALAPAFVLWAATMGRMRAAGLALAVGAAGFAAFAVALAGDVTTAVALTEAYVRDLIFVAGSSIRPAPGAGPMQLIAAPTQALGTMLCVVGAVILMAARLRAEAAVWLAAFAGIVMIAWQNFGNEMLGQMAFAAAFPAIGVTVARAAPGLLVAGRPAAKVLGWFAAAMLVIGVQQALVLQRSVFAGWRADPSGLHAPLAYIGAPDIAFPQGWNGVLGLVELVETDIEIDADLTMRERETLTYRGARAIGDEAFPSCSIGSGWDQTWRELTAAWRTRPDLAGRTVIQADTINFAWLLLGAPPQKGAPIWHYDNLGPALAGADLLLVARCPVSRRNRNMILDEAVAAGLTLRPVLSTEMWAAFEIAAPE